MCICLIKTLLVKTLPECVHPSSQTALTTGLFRVILRGNVTLGGHACGQPTCVSAAVFPLTVLRKIYANCLKDDKIQMRNGIGVFIEWCYANKACVSHPTILRSEENMEQAFYDLVPLMKVMIISSNLSVFLVERMRSICLFVVSPSAVPWSTASLPGVHIAVLDVVLRPFRQK